MKRQKRAFLLIPYKLKVEPRYCSLIIRRDHYKTFLSFPSFNLCHFWSLLFLTEKNFFNFRDSNPGRLWSKLPLEPFWLFIHFLEDLYLIFTLETVKRCMCRRRKWQWILHFYSSRKNCFFFQHWRLLPRWRSQGMDLLHRQSWVHHALVGQVAGKGCPVLHLPDRLAI